jgi:thymidylate synthase (FAD)
MSDALIGKTVKVLDQGSVQLVARMGDDRAIVAAARVSFLQDLSGHSDSQDKRLIRYLLYHQHTTPFEHVVFKFRVVAPVVVWWQWVRHRVGLSFNFQSGRYTQFAEDQFYAPSVWRKQSASNKQGSEGELSAEDSVDLTHRLLQRYGQSYADYERALELGVSKEQARLFLLGWGSYYTVYVTANARALMNFLELRLDAHAQEEIRAYAHVLYHEFFKPALPWTSEYFEDYRQATAAKFAMLYEGQWTEYEQHYKDWRESKKKPTA